MSILANTKMLATLRFICKLSFTANSVQFLWILISLTIQKSNANNVSQMQRSLHALK